MAALLKLEPLEAVEMSQGLGVEKEAVEEDAKLHLKKPSKNHLYPSHGDTNSQASSISRIL